MSSETTLSSPVDSSLAAIMKHLEQGNLEAALSQLADPKNGLPPSLGEAIQKKLRLSMQRDIKEATEQYVATLSAPKPAAKINALFNLPICRHLFSFINTGKVEDKVNFAAACKHFELAVATAKFFAEQEKKGSRLGGDALKSAKDDDPQYNDVTSLGFSWARNKEEEFAQLINDHPKICSQVKELVVQGYEDSRHKHLTLLAKFPALRSLDIQLNGDVRIDDTKLKLIANSCPALRNFNFSQQSQYDVQISKDGFMLMEKFPFLQSLAINSKALVATPKLPNLRKFSVYGKGDFKILIEFLKMHPKITELTLWGIGLTDDKLAEIVKVAPQLTSLNLKYPGELTQKGLSALAGLRQLTSITLEGTFDDSDIIALGSLCPKLQQAYFPNCERGAEWGSPVKKLSDEAVIAFANKCPNLIFLELGASDITTKSLEHLAKHCPKLHSVGVLWCKKLPPEPGKYPFKLVNYNWLKNL
jgi:hypothetical protein